MRREAVVVVDKSCINVGILGWGTVGTGVSKILINQNTLISKNSGIQLYLKKVVKRTLPASREGIELPTDCLTTDPVEVVDNPEIDIVVELIGGVPEAHSLITRAIQNGKHVVTANKALLAEHGGELFQLAQKHQVSLNFEASTAGGIPIIKTLQESFTANQIQSIYGIVNGTCNYMLTEMNERGVDFADVLADAQEKGYAEADPTLDIEGIDAAQKLTLLIALAYGVNLSVDQFHVEGITDISQKEIQYAHELGYVIKLLAIAKLTDDNRVEARVHPTLLPERSLLANVGGAFNAVCVIGSAVGPTLFYGQGAGEMPTASAVVADIIDAAKSIQGGVSSPISQAWLANSQTEITVCSIDDIETRYYLRFVVIDRPGVLANIGSILGNHNISIASVIQKEPHGTDTVSLMMLTHQAREKNMKTALEQIYTLEVVKGDAKLIRIEEEVAF
ncbi:homoserine dehydrogenase [Candidatus Poribacteria bacterium]|nr:MAG: homoserine dehydrogenase [Candidatus Poribacteria bacterium]